MNQMSKIVNGDHFRNTSMNYKSEKLMGQQGLPYILEWDQVFRGSKHLQSTGHTRTEPSSMIMMQSYSLS
jgi:hypothetical protein